MNEYIKEQVERIKNLPDNWDGYNSPHVSIGVCENVIWVIENIPEALDLMPDICPVSGGRSVQLEWQNGNKELEIEIEEEKISYLEVDNNKKNGEEPFMEEGKFIFLGNYQTKYHIEQLIKWLIGSK